MGTASSQVGAKEKEAREASCVGAAILSGGWFGLLELRLPWTALRVLVRGLPLN